MMQVYNVVSCLLGSPPTEFTFEFYDKEKNYKKIGPCTPLQFYQEHIKPVYDVANKVRLTE